MSWKSCWSMIIFWLSKLFYDQLVWFSILIIRFHRIKSHCIVRSTSHSIMSPKSCHSGASWSWNESPSPSYPITREHIGSGWMYRNVYKRICMYISCSNRGPCHDVRIRPRSNWELYLDNLIWMYFLVSKLAIGSWQITSLKIC